MYISTDKGLSKVGNYNATDILIDELPPHKFQFHYNVIQFAVGSKEIFRCFR